MLRFHTYRREKESFCLSLPTCLLLTCACTYFVMPSAIWWHSQWLSTEAWTGGTTLFYTLILQSCGLNKPLVSVKYPLQVFCDSNIKWVTAMIPWGNRKYLGVAICLGENTNVTEVKKPVGTRYCWPYVLEGSFWLCALHGGCRPEQNCIKTELVATLKGKKVCQRKKQKGPTGKPSRFLRQRVRIRVKWPEWINIEALTVWIECLDCCKKIP